MTADEAKNKEQYAINRLQDAKDGYKEYLTDEAIDIAIKAIEQTTWIPVSERLPETDNENSMNKYNVLLWVANKTYPEREPQIYLGKLRQVKGDDGSGNFWGIKTEPCEWTIWGWSYFNEPEVIAWMPLPQPYKAESEE